MIGAGMAHSFYWGHTSVGFYTKKHGAVMATVERDPVFPTRVLVFRKIGQTRRIHETSLQEWQAESYLRNLMREPAQ